MNFSKTTEYSLRILSYMAKDETKLYSVAEIFQHVEIPYRYLRKLMTNLTKGELIISIQGKFGGYKFAKPLQEIKLIEIIKTVEPEFLSYQCFFGLHECALQNTCIMHDQWKSVNSQISDILEKTTLLDIKHDGGNSILNSTNNSLKI